MIDKMLSDMCWDYDLWGEDTKFVYKLVLFVLAVTLVALFISVGIFVGQKTASVDEPVPIVSEVESPSKDININVNVN